jgi:hypothetical protein
MRTTRGGRRIAELKSQKAVICPGEHFPGQAFEIEAAVLCFAEALCCRALELPRAAMLPQRRRAH